MLKVFHSGEQRLYATKEHGHGYGIKTLLCLTRCIFSQQHHTLQAFEYTELFWCKRDPVPSLVSLVRLVARAVFMLWMFCFSEWLGLIVAWRVEKKKVPYCFSAVDSCCYATNRMSLSAGYIKFVFPAHISERSFLYFNRRVRFWLPVGL